MSSRDTRGVEAPSRALSAIREPGAAQPLTSRSTAPIANNASRLRANGMSDSHFASRFVSRDDRAARGAARRRPRHDSAMEEIAEELGALRAIGWLSRGVVRALVSRRAGGESANAASAPTP